MQGLAQLPVTELKGVGAKAAEKLAKLAIVSVQDLLFHLPHRYEDRTRIYPIADLHPHCDFTFFPFFRCTKKPS